jgi:hypothetical protein
VKRLEELEAQKRALIERYMQLQDVADNTNEQIYKITCEIARLNLQIQTEKKKPSPNGKPVTPESPKPTQA